MFSFGAFKVTIGLICLAVTAAVGYHAGILLAAREQKIRCPFCQWLIPNGTALFSEKVSSNSFCECQAA
jgi:hypothetical protein